MFNKVHVVSMYGFLGAPILGFGFSKGMQDLAQAMAASDKRVQAYDTLHWTSWLEAAAEVNAWPETEAVFAFGHSMGGTALTDMQKFCHRKINVMIGFDPQQQLGSPIPFLPLEPNVVRALCFSGQNAGIPGHGEFVLTGGNDATDLHVRHVQLSHLDIARDKALAGLAMDELKKLLT